MMRAGLLGAARIAPKAFIAPAKARGDIDIVAVGCRDVQKAQGFIQNNELSSARAVSYEAVCTDPTIDIVYCALPPSAHLYWVGLALENGKAVLCEKPFSMNVQEAQKMADVSEKTGALLMEGYHYSFHNAFKFVKAQIAQNRIGELVSFRGEFSHTIPNRPQELRYQRALGGGALMDLGCYPLHAFRQLVGEPKILTAKAHMTGDVDSVMTAHMSCENVTGAIHCDMTPSASGVKTLEIIGSQGRIDYNGFIAPHDGHSICITFGDKQDVYDIPGLSTYRAQLEAFIGTMQGESNLLPPVDSVLQMSAIDEIYALAGIG